ncbi:MAG: T9SS type A sorting domain-containing protein, partial [Chitinophagales bacterium]
MIKIPLVRACTAFVLFNATLCVFFTQSVAYTVSGFACEYHYGQNFITWNNPNATNLQYNVYRSTVPILLSSQLTSANYLGFVRDNSSLNLFWTQQSDMNVYYKITATSQPLAASKGLYVVTCSDNLLYYYVVTVTNLSNGKEDKTFLPGINSNLLPIADLVAKPQPVLQNSVITHNDEIKKVYVQYVDNRDTPLFPALNSTGSFGFNFFLVKRGTATRFPLFLLFEGFGNDATKSINLDESYDNCYAMGVFDWLPIPADDGSIGDNVFFIGYHEDFNIYSNTGTIPTSGIVKTYSQKLYMEAINWLKTQVPIDTTRVYCKGTSSCGYGGLVMAALHPEKIAAVYSMVEPNSTSASTDVYKQMWGAGSSKLKTDVLKWNTSDTLAFTDLKDIQKMLHYNELRSMPVIYDIHGKKDDAVIWNEGKITWLDSLESNKIGGAWYWDQREHGGKNKNFTDVETEPDYYRFATNLSYPAFKNCSINQNPGNGGTTNGDKYGAINGYLDWRDDNIADKSCSYIIHIFVKDLYVGGVLDPEQYSTCTTDISFRRMQNFQPTIGSVIQWSNFDDVTNIKIQHGSFTYNGGIITVPGLTIKKTSNKIKLKIKNCSSRLENDEEGDDLILSQLEFFKTPGGYQMNVNSAAEESATIRVLDLMGRMVWERDVNFLSGNNTINIPAPGSGIYVVQIIGKSL